MRERVQARGGAAGRRFGRARAVAALVGALVLGGCEDVFNDIIQVEPQDRVARETLDDPAQAALLAASVQATFECAFGGYVLAGGLFTDELQSQGNTAIYSYDRRDPNPAGGFVGIYADGGCTGISPGLYTPLSSARWFADELLKTLRDEWTDAEVANRQQLIATAALYAGYSLVLLGESMCTAALDLGPELDADALLALAEDRFTTAIEAAQAANSAELLNAARVGRARARIDQGQDAGAAADARLVPAGFAKVATRAAGHATRENPIYSQITEARGGNMGVQEPFRSLTWEGVPDPRVPVIDAGINSIGEVFFDQRKYNSDADPIPLATWEEAQLIIAEVEARSGDLQAAVDILDALHIRAGIPGYAPVAPTRTEVLQHVQEERKRELFLEGHRTGDVRRFDQEQIPAPGTPYRFGGIYDDLRCFPLPDVERRTNPNL